MLIDFGVDDEVAPWGVEEEVLSDLDDETCTPEMNIFDFPVLVGSLPGTRRDQLENLVHEEYTKWYNFQPGDNAINSDSEIDPVALSESFENDN